MRRTQLLCWLALSVVGCVISPARTDVEFPPPYEENGVHVRLYGVLVNRWGGVAAFPGVAKNTSGQDLASVTLTFGLYDADGAKVGQAIAITSDLKKDDVWKFQATVIGQHTSVRFKRVKPGRVQVILASALRR